MLECVGVCWSVLECVAVKGLRSGQLLSASSLSCPVLQYVAVSCSMLQCVEFVLECVGV